MYRIIVIALIALTFTGCVASNLAEVMQAVGNDSASLSVTISTPWGTLRVNRSNPTAQMGKVSVTGDGISVDNTVRPGTANVPVTTPPMTLVPVPGGFITTPSLTP